MAKNKNLRVLFSIICKKTPHAAIKDKCDFQLPTGMLSVGP